MKEASHKRRLFVFNYVRVSNQLVFAHKNLGAQKGTRTPTMLPPLVPETSASTNSAIWARRNRILPRVASTSPVGLSAAAATDIGHNVVSGTPCPLP